ncbi:C39 family peptidase [Nitrosococcus halophilus]|nr:C39 family peptidase [Nitrosococcus halophilus]
MIRKQGCSPVYAVLLIVLLLANFAGTAEGRQVKSLLEMRRENVILQQWDLSCGAAALATLLNYQHGDSVAEKEVAKALMTRKEYLKNPAIVQIREGFSLLDLKRFVDSRGYKGIGYGKLALEDLIERAPILVPINTHGYNHFVIFRGVQGNRVLLADPAWGNRTMLIRKFKQFWIEYPQFGKVGFIVTRRDGIEPPNRLTPKTSDFVMLR